MDHSRRSPTVAAPFRALALAAAALLCVSKIAGVIHVAAVEHVVCPEHGTLAHVGNADPAQIHSVTELPVLNGSSPAEVGENHEHCGFLAVSRADGLSAAGEPTLSVPPCTEATVVSISRALLGSVARYLVAPKQSPPRA